MVFEPYIPFHHASWDHGWRMGQFAALQSVGIPHAVTTRVGPDVQRVATETEAMGLQVTPGLGLDDVAFATQVHGPTARIVTERGSAGQADALCTDVPGLALVGKSADCPLVLLADSERPCVGFAHASWRSTVAGIVPALCACMVQKMGCDAGRLVACIGPSIGPECFEVGPEVEQAALREIGPHARAFFRPGPRRRHFDLWQANSDALLRCGVRGKHIFIAGECTLCASDLYPSYRREGPQAGRFMALIGCPRS